MRNILKFLVALVVLTSTAPASSLLPSVKTHYVEYVCDYFDPQTDITYYGCHHIRFDDLNGSLVEILD